MSRKLSFLVFILVLFAILAGCGGNPEPTPQNANITINVYDKGSSSSLSNVLLKVVETGQNYTISGNSYQITLEQKTYTIFLSKSGYITRGYVFNLTGNVTVNVYLQPVNPEPVVLGNINGTVNDGGVIYQGQVFVCPGNPSHVDFTANAVDNPFSVQSVYGDIVVSAYTKSGDSSSNSIEKIAYVKTPFQQENNPLNLAAPLELPSGIVSYYGNKPGTDTLTVKLGSGYFLADQNSDELSYSFLVNLLAGDTVTLESEKNDMEKNIDYFTRVNAGMGGSTNISYQSGAPDFTISDNGNYYTLGISAVSFADCYEVYAIEQTEEVKLTFQAFCVSGTSVKLPKNLFTTGVDVNIYVKAIKLNGFSTGQILDNSQSFAGYSYTQTGQTFSLAGSGLKLASLSAVNKSSNIDRAISQKYHLQYLCLE